VSLRALAVAAVVLPVAVALLLAVAPGTPAPPTHADFQRLVGGLGLGPAIDFSRCAHEFDPRVQPACSWRYEPLPCGNVACPSHAR